MAHKQHWQTVPAPEWWKHLKYHKRTFWKRQRRAFKEELRRERDRPEG